MSLVLIIYFRCSLVARHLDMYFKSSEIKVFTGKQIWLMKEQEDEGFIVQFPHITTQKKIKDIFLSKEIDGVQL